MGVSILATALITESSVVTASVLGGVGWMIVRAIGRSDRRESTETDHGTRLLLLERDVTALQSDLDQSKRHRAAMSEELSTLGALFERHERWHERHDPTAPSEP